MDTEWAALIALSLSAYATLVYTVALEDYETVYVTSVLLLSAALVGLLAMGLRPLLARIAFMRSDYVLKCSPNNDCTVSLVAPGAVAAQPVGNASQGVLDISLTMLASCSAFFGARIREQKNLMYEVEQKPALNRPALYGITFASWVPTFALAIHSIYRTKDTAETLAFAMALGSLVGTASQVLIGNHPTYTELVSR